MQGGSGKILQRFPEKDWEEVPFIAGIELVRKSNGILWMNVGYVLSKMCSLYMARVWIYKSGIVTDSVPSKSVCRKIG